MGDWRRRPGEVQREEGHGVEVACARGNQGERDKGQVDEGVPRPVRRVVGKEDVEPKFISLSMLVKGDRATYISFPRNSCTAYVPYVVSRRYNPTDCQVGFSDH